ncbi:SAV_915 family protein [Kribbella sp. NBC_00359]|uniref:SAV_915 family protein n=1 Tax=Kribbella sp. NBC_00359 TaxID=2975966 RepID=UPI002E232E82
MKPRHSLDWFVPVHSTGAAAALQTGRLPDGRRVGIAFTTLAKLRAATGPRQEWMRLTEAALRETLAPLGVTRIQLDPVLVGPDVSSRPSEMPHPGQPAFVH